MQVTFKAETISQVTRIQKNQRLIMCLEESFCPFTRDALNFRQLKIYAAPHRPAVFGLLSLSHHHSAAWRSALSYRSVTAHAHRKSRVRSNNAPTRKVCNVSILVAVCSSAAVLWHAVVQMISFTDLLPAMLCSHALIIQLCQGFHIFIHVHLMFPYTESSFIFLSHWFTRSDDH